MPQVRYVVTGFLLNMVMIAVVAGVDYHQPDQTSPLSTSHLRTRVLPPPEIQAQRNRDLFAAVGSGVIVRVKQLLADGADINSRQRPWNLTPLLIAPDVNLEMVKFLVEQGAEINVADKEGTTVLVKAVRAFSLASVKYLLDKGADLKTADGRGNTAFTHAVLQSSPEIVMLLIQRGADVNVVTDSGATPLSIAKNVRRAAENMHANMDMDMKADAPFHAGHPMRTKAQALKQTEQVLQMLEAAGATLDQQPIQRSEAQRHEHHAGHH